MFPYETLHRYTSTSPDSKTDNQIGHILTNRRWHSSILDVRSFWEADSDTDHYLMVAKFREKLAVSKLLTQMLHAESFNLKKLSELEVRKQYQLRISKRFATLENLNVSKDINRFSENIKENIKTSAQEGLRLHDRNKHKPWFTKKMRPCTGHFWMPCGTVSCKGVLH
jgi:hypothetical protein